MDKSLKFNCVNLCENSLFPKRCLCLTCRVKQYSPKHVGNRSVCNGSLKVSQMPILLSTVQRRLFQFYYPLYFLIFLLMRYVVMSN